MTGASPTISAPAPCAEKLSYKTHHHGITRNDPYHWMRDKHWQDVMRDTSLLRDDIHTHLMAENKYCADILADHHAITEQLYQDMRGRIKEDDTTPPIPFAQFSWFEQFRPDDEHPLICRADRAGKNVRIILNGNEEAKKTSYCKFGQHVPSPDQNLLAWTADIKGSEFFTIKIRDIASGCDLPDQLDNSSGACAWSQCGCYLFYVGLDEHLRPHKIMRHRLGTTQAEDALIYKEPHAGFFVGLSHDRAGHYIFINIHDHVTSEIWLLNAHAPETEPVLVAKRQAGIEYHIEHDAARKRFLILTNKDAPDFQIMTSSVDAPADWHSFHPHQQGTLLLNVIPYQNHIAILARINALPNITIIDAQTNTEHQIAFSEEAYALELHAGYEYDTTLTRFAYSSMTTPQEVFDYDMAQRIRTLVNQQTIPSGHNQKYYITRRLWAVASDGARIPISVLYHKDTTPDENTPLLLYGYGAYGFTMPASFSATRLSLVERGFIYAIAHIRGGRAMGQDWFLQGRGKMKQNSFTDFLAAARHLIAQGFTKRDNITIHGGSAGGLLIGAVLNLAPDLFRGAVAEVPFVDTLTTMLDDTLPLTPPEWPEWGNPIKNAEDYATIAAYAPYENIKQTAYPHILATGGLTDPRVTYWEPAKWVARLRATRTDDRLTLLRMNMEAGHGGKSGRWQHLREIAFIYTFILFIHNRT